jgi:hypothetical protein
MACFLVPMGEAVVTTLVQKVMEKRAGGERGKIIASGWSRKLSWLNYMLWGGTLMLMAEHVWNGELVLRPPFLTAMSNPADTAVALREMATLGVAMAVFVTAVWGIMVLVVELKARALPAAKGSPVLRG